MFFCFHWHPTKNLLVCFFPTKHDKKNPENDSIPALVGSATKKGVAFNPSSGTLWSHRATSRWSGVRPPLTEMSSMTKGRLSKWSAVEKSGSLHPWHLPTSTESKVSKRVDGGSNNPRQSVLPSATFCLCFIGCPFQVQGAMCGDFLLIFSRSLVERFLRYHFWTGTGNGNSQISDLEILRWCNWCKMW